MAPLFRHQRGPCADGPAGAAPPGPRARAADSAGLVSADRPTARQEVVLRAIRDVIADTGDAPTVREIGQRVGLASSGSLAYQPTTCPRPSGGCREEGRAGAARGRSRRRAVRTAGRAALPAGQWGRGGPRRDKKTCRAHGSVREAPRPCSGRAVAAEVVMARRGAGGSGTTAAWAVAPAHAVAPPTAPPDSCALPRAAPAACAATAFGRSGLRQ
ncbi:hypothetical protein [Streptomyces sp. NPDC058545]|uniref:LexA family protein n=1 Tax=Streptomyces sp. NPDC058545 TaxID=3346544 RepID=UPI003649542C